jgi:hypothetical protein
MRLHAKIKVREALCHAFVKIEKHFLFIHEVHIVLQMYLCQTQLNILLFFP